MRLKLKYVRRWICIHKVKNYDKLFFLFFRLKFAIGQEYQRTINGQARSCIVTIRTYFFQEAMARGNQRDLARAKNQKKQQELAKGQKKDGDPKKRMETDAEKMRQKQALGMYAF